MQQEHLDEGIVGMQVSPFLFADWTLQVCETGGQQWDGGWRRRVESMARDRGEGQGLRAGAGTCICFLLFATDCGSQVLWKQGRHFT